MKILVVDACVRGNMSRTRRLYEALLEKHTKDNEIEILRLAEKELKPLTAEDTAIRSERVNDGQWTHEMFYYANQFKNADCIIIAAPYWDLSFPSVLKIYIEHISVAGITFGYEGAECVGYCKANRLIYLSTCGGFVQGAHLGAEYVKAVGAMFGIHDFQKFSVYGLDIDPSQSEAIMTRGIEQMLNEIRMI